MPPSHMPADRDQSWRRHAAWFLTLGLVVVWSGVDRPQLALVDPPAAASLTDWLAAILALTFDETPVSRLVTILNVLMLLAAVSALGTLLVRATRDRIVTTAMVLAAVSTPALSRSTAPGAAGAIALAAIALLVTWPMNGVRPRPGRRWALAVTTAILASAAAPATLAGISPAVYGLAALGLFAHRSSLARSDALVTGAVVALAPLLGWLVLGQHITINAVPIVALWAVAALGLGYVRRQATTRWARVAALGLVVVVPMLHAARLQPEVLESDLPRGHLDLSSRGVSAIRSAVEPGAAVVIEDALSRILWLGLRDTKQLTFVRPDDRLVRSALARGPVYALPRAQRALQLVGFRMHPTGRAGVPGLATIADGPPCVGLSADWTIAPALTARQGLTLVADARDSRGPAVVYLAGDHGLGARRHDWPLAALRGFHTTAYDLTVPDDRIALEDDAAHDALPALWTDGQWQHVLRLEVWRLPDSPLLLPVRIDGEPGAAWTRALRPDTPPVRICPAGFEPVETLVARRR